MKRKLLLAGLLILAAMLIAFLLRDVVEVLIIRPLAYLFWVLGVIYHFIPQPVLWLLLVLLMIYNALGRVAASLNLPGSDPRPLPPSLGPVNELASLIQRKDGGIYFKWKIARTLAQIASEMQELRLHFHSRKLDFEGKAVTPGVRRYLDAGQNTSFSDYPLSKFTLSIPGLSTLLRKMKLASFLNVTDQPARPTPFDGDISPVIEYLESELENENDFRRS